MNDYALTSWMVSLLALLCFPMTRPRAQQPAPGVAQQPPFVFSKADTVIYVSDFELHPQHFQADEGPTKILPHPRIIETPLQKERGQSA